MEKRQKLYYPIVKLVKSNAILAACGLCIGYLVDQVTGQPIPGCGDENEPKDNICDFEQVLTQMAVDKNITKEGMSWIVSELRRLHFAEDKQDIWRRIMSLSRSDASLEGWVVKIGKEEGRRVCAFFKENTLIGSGFDTHELAYEQIIAFVGSEICTVNEAMVLFQMAVREISDPEEIGFSLPISLKMKLWRTRNRPLLNRAKIVYGLIILENGSAWSIVSREELAYILCFSRGDGLTISEQEAGRIQRELEVFQFLPNFGEVVKKLSQVRFGAGADLGGIKFALCNRSDCPHDHPHGFFSDQGRVISCTMETIRGCVEEIEDFLGKGMVSVDGALKLFHECLAANLFLDEIDMLKDFIDYTKKDCCVVVQESLPFGGVNSIDPLVN